MPAKAALAARPIPPGGHGKKLGACARQQGVTTETLINIWLAEKLAMASQGKE
jgi:hypothetical protein